MSLDDKLLSIFASYADVGDPDLDKLLNQIHKAFAEEGYSIPPSPQGWLMSGQEWYDRLQEELKQAQYVVHKDDLVTVLNKAAKRASGIEK